MARRRNGWNAASRRCARRTAPVWSANRNQAFKPFEELFEDRSLAEKTVYRKVTAQLPEYFATRPLIPIPDAKPVSLLDLLHAPAAGSPGSLSEQLDLIRRLWKPLLGDAWSASC